MLHLLAPFLPFACEDILHETFPRTAAHVVSIHARGGWPKAEDYPVAEAALEAGALAVEVLGKVRAAKSERGVSIKTPVGPVTMQGVLPQDALADLTHTASASEIRAGAVFSMAWT